MAKTTVMAYERVVRFVNGAVRDVLGPGRHSYRRRGTRLERVDVRPRLLAVPGQEIFTADGLTIRVSVVIRLAVTDPVAHLTAALDAQQEVYLATQSALRDAVNAVTLEQLLAARQCLAANLLDAVRATGTRVGMGVEEIVVRDLMLPGELRRAYAETAMARERGRADLERARAEAAALRALANTAKLLEEHPALLHLRTLQAASEPGTTLVLAPNGGWPVPGQR